MTPPFRHIGVGGDDVVAVVTIDRAGDDLNRVDGELHHDLASLFGWLRSEPPARAVLLRAEGRAFSAGGDYRWFPELQEEGRLEALGAEGRSLVLDLLDVRVPIVCEVGGAAVGLGATIALLCDIVVVGASATIADPHVRVGVVAGDGGVIAWPAALGPLAAKRWLLTGDAISADDAVRLGLATEIVADEELPVRAMAWAQRLAAGAPLALAGTKAAVNAAIKEQFVAAFELSMALEMETFRTADHAEALAALRDKRAPRFEGR